jgi:[FeFe] hydrogenase (group B1/B3)
MRKYENQVQMVKSEVLKMVARYAFEGNLTTKLPEIPVLVNPGPEARFRCCVYHERAVTAERVKLAIGGNPYIPNVIEVIEPACDKCPVDRYFVTEACRGCLAHRCHGSCPVGAINIENGRAHIDQDKCIECGKCKESCPYNAIADVMRPCRRDCPTDAIKIDHRKKAVIDHDKCISCGACVYQCPFGAIQDKSEITEVIRYLNDDAVNVYAMLAPAVSTQFEYASLGQVVQGLKHLGFKDVVEVALGADMVTLHESEELMTMKSMGKTMTSSCCPSFVMYVEQKYPELLPHVSQTVSPMVATARLIKSTDPAAKVVFVGPCIAKKKEKTKTADTDFVLTFEELAALIDAKEIDLEALEGAPLDNASYYGRKFAASGGVSGAVVGHLTEKGVTDIVVEACDGIAACDKALKLLKFGRLKADFIEGMACKGGCIKGPVTMHHGPKDLKALDRYAQEAKEKTSVSAAQVFETLKIELN